MKLVQFIEPGDGMHVGVVEGDEVLDLTGAEGVLRTVYEIYYDCSGDEKGLVAAVNELKGLVSRHLSFPELLANRGTDSPYLTKPISGPTGHPHALRVWLAGAQNVLPPKGPHPRPQQPEPNPCFHPSAGPTTPRCYRPRLLLLRLHT